MGILQASANGYFASLSCYTAPDPSSYYGIVHPGKVHVQDFSSSFAEPEEAFYAGLALFQMGLDEWLPCFFTKD